MDSYEIYVVDRAIHFVQIEAKSKAEARKLAIEGIEDGTITPEWDGSEWEIADERQMKLKKLIRKTLANDICSAQCLDVAADRKRVEKELYQALSNLF